jgi:hypothetical protein
MFLPEDLACALTIGGSSWVDGTILAHTQNLSNGEIYLKGTSFNIDLKLNTSF